MNRDDDDDEGDDDEDDDDADDDDNDDDDGGDDDDDDDDDSDDDGDDEDPGHNNLQRHDCPLSARQSASSSIVSTGQPLSSIDNCAGAYSNARLLLNGSSYPGQQGICSDLYAF